MRKLRTVEVDPDPVPKPEESSPEIRREVAAAVSRDLQRVLEETDKRERLSSARTAVFENANAPKEVEMPRPMRRLVESQFEGELDFEAEHRELEHTLDSTAAKPGHQVHELERAELMGRRAARLLMRFKQVHFEWEMDNRVLFAGMRQEATKALQSEKAQGYRNKQITDADVDTMCASLFPDEWRVQEVKRNRAKLTEKSLEHLVEAWSSKCRSLNVLVGKGR